MRLRPMFEMLSASGGRLSMHMPGHKGRAPFGPVDVYALDTTELPATDDLYAPRGAIQKAQALYALAAGAGETLFLHGGSTAGIQAMLLYSARPGETVILPRNAHISAINGCILGDLRPVYAPCSLTGDGYAYVAEETFLALIAAHPEARAVLVTRPDYYGCALPLGRIAQAAHGQGMRLIVDEAHGAHLPFMGAKLSAGALGADLWVQSVHKTLPGLTGAAVLHLRAGEDPGRIRRIMRMIQTSSPSFALLMAIDDARAYMEAAGRRELERVCAWSEGLRARLGDPRESWRQPGGWLDPARLVSWGPEGGYALRAALAERGIDAEMADDRRCVCILSAMDSPEALHRLGKALEELACPPPALPRKAHAAVKAGSPAMPPRQAALAPVSWVPLEQALGRIAAGGAGPYPPGIPLVMPGERYTQTIIEALQTTPSRFGLEGGCCACVEE